MPGFTPELIIAIGGACAAVISAILTSLFGPRRPAADGARLSEIEDELDDYNDRLHAHDVRLTRLETEVEMSLRRR